MSTLRCDIMNTQIETEHVDLFRFEVFLFYSQQFLSLVY